MPRVPYLADERAARAEAANKPLVVIDRATKTMRLERPGKTALLTAAAKPVSIEKSPPSPPEPTGLTTTQQGALYYSRKHRRQRLGIVPRPPLP